MSKGRAGSSAERRPKTPKGWRVTMSTNYMPGDHFNPRTSGLVRKRLASVFRWVDGGWEFVTCFGLPSAEDDAVGDAAADEQVRAKALDYILAQAPGQG